MKNSIKSNLVKSIINDFCLKNLFSSFDKIDIELQNELDSHLKFETKVCNLKQSESNTSGQVFLEDENGIYRVIDFTVMPTGVIL